MAAEVIDHNNIRKYKFIVVDEVNDLNKLRNLNKNTKAIVIFRNDLNMYNTYHFEPINASGVDIIIYGCNHTINNLRIYRPDEKFVGFFSKVRNLYIRNLSISNFKIFSDEVSGPLAGEVEESLKIDSIKSTSFIKSDAISGGLVGIASNISVTNSNINSSISGRGSLGGIAGQAQTYKFDTNTYVTTYLDDSYRKITSDTATNHDIGYLNERENKKIQEMLKTIKY